MAFPIHRPRRLRRNEVLRSMVTETRLSRQSLIAPLFITAGHDIREPISSMPGQYRWSLDRLPEMIDTLGELDLPAVLLFGLPESKDVEATGAWHAEGVVQQATRLFKQRAPRIQVVCDTCLCEYTSHGHCGVIENGEVRNDPTLDLLASMALSHAKAGAESAASRNGP